MGWADDLLVNTSEIKEFTCKEGGNEYVFSYKKAGWALRARLRSQFTVTHPSGAKITDEEKLIRELIKTQIVKAPFEDKRWDEVFQKGKPWIEELASEILSGTPITEDEKKNLKD